MVSCGLKGIFLNRESSFYLRLIKLRRKLSRIYIARTSLSLASVPYISSARELSQQLSLSTASYFNTSKTASCTITELSHFEMKFSARAVFIAGVGFICQLTYVFCAVSKEFV